MEYLGIAFSGRFLVGGFQCRLMIKGYFDELDDKAASLIPVFLLSLVAYLR